MVLRTVSAAYEAAYPAGAHGSRLSLREMRAGWLRRREMQAVLWMLEYINFDVCALEEGAEV